MVLYLILSTKKGTLPQSIVLKAFIHAGFQFTKCFVCFFTTKNNYRTISETRTQASSSLLLSWLLHD